MARDLTSLFNLVAPAQKNSSTSAISKVLAFDDLGDFVEERQRIARKLENIKTAAPKPDLTDFSNHVFFDSAVSKFSIARDKILNTCPFSGDSEDKDLFAISASLYESQVISEWPRNVGYVFCSGSAFITGSDVSSKLFVGTSSLYVSARIAPAIPSMTYTILSVLSGTTLGSQYGYSLLASTNAFTLRVLSGVYQNDYTANFPTSIQNTMSTVAAMYDTNAQQMTMFLNNKKISSTPVSMGSKLTFGPATITVGKNMSGSIGEIRVMHTASELFHYKNYNRPITSEDYVKLNYRFNEGVTNNALLDINVIDYSKNGLHGKINNFNSLYRLSGSTAAIDPGDLILYPTHPDVQMYCVSNLSDAQAFDDQNRNSILRLIPEQILSDDQDSQGLLTSFALAMARYFDELKVYLDQFDNLRITNYQDVNETPDVMLPFLKKYFGWKVTDHYGDSDPLQFLFGENVLPSGSIDAPLIEIRDQFWRRIMNNLPYLYKSKGKRSNIQSFFNILGINKNLINLKEYGTAQRSNIVDERIVKQKSISLVDLYSDAAVWSPTINTGVTTGFTMECFAKPRANLGELNSILYASQIAGQSYYVRYFNPSSYSSSLGFIDFFGPTGLTRISASVFNNDLVHFSLKADKSGLISFGVRQSKDGILTNRTTGSVTQQPFTGGLPISFTWGVSYTNTAAPAISQARAYQRCLTETDLDEHALNFENIADSQAFVSGSSSLIVHYPFADNVQSDGNGMCSVVDYSGYNRSGTITSLTPFSNSFSSQLITYSYLSPIYDLKWTENKIRIRNASKITRYDAARDTNDLSLEFNLADSLNEDIVRILSSFDAMNNVIGSPINKYRSEYVELEAYRQLYFSRLSDSLNFTRFFKLFKWFDRKIGLSIQQLVPARVNFIGGQFVVDSHVLERNKYQYQYPVFKTPKDISEGSVKVGTLTGSVSVFLTASMPLQGTLVRNEYEKESKRGRTTLPRQSTYMAFGTVMPTFKNVDGPDFARTSDNPYYRFPAATIFVNPTFADATSYTCNSYLALSSDAPLRLTASVNDIGNGQWQTLPMYVGANAPCTASFVATMSAIANGRTHSVIVCVTSSANWDTTGPAIKYYNFSGGTAAGQQTAPLVISASNNADASGFVYFYCYFTDIYNEMRLFNFSATGLKSPASLFAPRYTSNNSDTSSIQNAANGINFSNEYPRRIQDRRTSLADGKIVNQNMTSGLWAANPNIFSNVSSDSSEVHFAGQKKNIKLRAAFLSGSATQFSMSLSGSTHLYLFKSTLKDPSGYQFPASYSGSDDATTFFGSYYQGWNTDQIKPGCIMQIKASGSNIPFSAKDFQVNWFDGTGKAWDGNNWFARSNTFVPMKNDPGWYLFRFPMDFPYQASFSIQSMTARDLNTNLRMSIDMLTSGAVYSFKDCYLEFPAQLTDAGVAYYNRLANSRTSRAMVYGQNSPFCPRKPQIFSGTYFPWQGSSIAPNITGAGKLGKSGRYYDWDLGESLFYVSNDYGKTIQLRSTTSGNFLFSVDCFILDSTNEKNMFVAECAFEGNGVQGVYASYDNGLSFKEVFRRPDSGFELPMGIASVGTNVVYGSPTAIVASTNYGASGSFYVAYSGSLFSDIVDDGVRISTTGQIYVLTLGKGLFRSMDGGYSYTNVLSSSIANFSGATPSVAVCPNGNVFVSALSKTSSGTMVIFSSSNGSAGSFSAARQVIPTGSLSNVSSFVVSDSSNNVYYFPRVSPTRASPFAINFSGDGGLTWQVADVLGYYDSGSFQTTVTYASMGGDGQTLYLTQFAYDYNTGFSGQSQRHVKPFKNTNSIAPLSLAPSTNFVKSQISGVIQQDSCLGNIGEFPHAGGLFQMRSLVLGTTDSGRLGFSDDSIVQVNHVGSVVNVMWPNQTTLGASVPGFGSLSPGQSPGLLQTSFTYGAAYDTTNYDHVSLYCYALKQANGTMEDIQIIVQRRPLKNIAFATDQTVALSGSGATTTARYTDTIHTKQIDYSDLTQKSVSFVIDVPLINVREIRIGVRQRYGQSDLNSNFLVWGRFIDSEKET